MRIAHFCDSHEGRPDGVSRSAALTVSLLREAGHEVIHVRPGPLFSRPRSSCRAAPPLASPPSTPAASASPSTSSSPPTTSSPRDGQVRSVPVPFRHVRLGLPFRTSLPYKPDLIHVHTTGPIGMAGFRLAAELGVPLVMTWHTDLPAYADFFPEIPIGAAWCATTLNLGWSPRDFLELARPGQVRHQRLLDLGRALFARMSAVIAPSTKTAAGFASFGQLPEVCILPTPTVPPAPTPHDTPERPLAPPTPEGSLTPPTPEGPLTPPTPEGPLTPSTPGLLPTSPVTQARPRSGPVVMPASWPSTGLVVLSVGRVSAEKNPSLLLHAFALVAAVKPDAHLVLVGVRQQQRQLRQLIAALGLTSRVLVIPPVPHEAVTSYYRAADVLAFSSTTDTQSLVLSEAEAAGLPTVVADPRLATRPDGSQRVTCAPTPSAFATALLRLLDDRSFRTATADAGLAATAAYPPSTYLARLTALYERCLSKEPQHLRPTTS